MQFHSCCKSEYNEARTNIRQMLPIIQETEKTLQTICSIESIFALNLGEAKDNKSMRILRAFPKPF